MSIIKRVSKANNLSSGRLEGNLLMRGLSFSGIDNVIDEFNSYNRETVDELQEQVMNKAKLKDEIIGLRADNPNQQTEIQSLLQSHGINQDALNLNLEDMRNPAAFEAIKSNLKKVTQNPRFRKVVTDQARADAFLEATKGITNPELRRKALETYEGYTEGAANADDLVPGHYQEIDIVAAAGQYLERVPAISRSKNIEGSIYDVSVRTSQAVNQVVDEMLKDPTIRNNVAVRYDIKMTNPDGSVNPEGMEKARKTLTEIVQTQNTEQRTYKRAADSSTGRLNPPDYLDKDQKQVWVDLKKMGYDPDGLTSGELADIAGLGVRRDAQGRLVGSDGKPLSETNPKLADKLNRIGTSTNQTTQQTSPSGGGTSGPVITDNEMWAKESKE